VNIRINKTQWHEIIDQFILPLAEQSIEFWI